MVFVGGAVLGTMLALEACHCGPEVVRLEADAGPRGASVRNFGLVRVGRRVGGPELDLAARSRDLWERIASHSPAVAFRPDGSVTVARHEGGSGLSVGDHPYGDLVALARVVPVGRSPRSSPGGRASAPSSPSCGSTLRAALATGVVPVTGPSGRGTTLTPALAEETREELTR